VAAERTVKSLVAAVWAAEVVTDAGLVSVAEM